MGFYMLTPHMSEPSMIKESLMRQVQPTVPQDDTSSFEAVADAASLEWGLFKCKPARDMAQGPTCRHWTDCQRGETGTGVATASRLSADAQSCEEAEPNCCLEGYTGFLCEECMPNFARIGGNCVPCTEPRVWKMGFGLVFAGAFVITLMYSSVKTLGNATAQFTIVIFFFQAVMLVIRGRYSSMAYFGSVVNLSPLDARQSDGCTIVGDTYVQWYFLVFGFPGMMVCIFFTLMAIAYFTTEEGGIIDEIKITLERSSHHQICEAVLKKSDLFMLLTEEERHELATRMVPKVLRKGIELTQQGHKERTMRVLLDGTCIVKHDAALDSPGAHPEPEPEPRPEPGDEETVRRKRQEYIAKLDGELRNMKPDVVEPGGVFGEMQQLKGYEAANTVVAWPHHVVVAILDEEMFDNLDKIFSDNNEFVAEFNDLRTQRQLAGHEPMRHHSGKHDASNGDSMVSIEQFEELAAEYDPDEDMVNREEEGEKIAEEIMVLAYQSSHRHVRETDWGHKQGRARFERFDKDSNGRHTGHLDQLQIRAMLVDMNIECTDQYLKKIVNRVDKNGDGKVDFNEFQVLWSLVSPPRGVKYGMPGTQADGLILEEAHTREIVDRCGCHRLAKRLSNYEELALANLYTACFDVKALKSTFLEMCLAVYCPILLEIPQIILCNSETMTLEYDPALPCGTWQHTLAQIVATLAMVFLVIGLPFVMMQASTTAALAMQSSYKTALPEPEPEPEPATPGSDTESPSSKKQRASKKRASKEQKKTDAEREWRQQHNTAIQEKALKVAKAKFVLHWDTMDPKMQQHEIDKCVTALHNEEFGSEVWFLANLQMSTKPAYAGWFPIWFVMSRSMLNLLFLMGKYQYLSLGFDWRVPALFVLAVSSAIHNRVEPFRHPSDNALYTVCLSMLMLVFTMDIADVTEDGWWSAFFAAFCSMSFTMLMLYQLSGRKRNASKAHRSWKWTRANWEKVVKLERVKEDYAARHIQNKFRMHRKNKQKKKAGVLKALTSSSSPTHPDGNRNGSSGNGGGTSMLDQAQGSIDRMRAEHEASRAADSTDNPTFDDDSLDGDVNSV
jgi:hypothetical protein